MKLSSLNVHNVWRAIQFCLVMPFAWVGRIRRPNVWIVTERPDQARDNGYVFFRYLREQHPEVDVHYIIDRQATDRTKLEPLGHQIAFDSWAHVYYYCLSRVHISAHVGGCLPSQGAICRRIKRLLRVRDVFIPHGVSYGVAEFCLKKNADIDLFICSGRPEYENVLANYGYSPDEVAYTGFPRLDLWHHCRVKKGQIVLMPTWRLYLAQDPATVFEETRYYRAYQELLCDSHLADFLIRNELKLVFYLHHEMRKYVKAFETECPQIEIVSDDKQYDIQELLKESALLITDYSSVHFDFAYMGKPVIYYQFDRDEFFARQYAQSAFDAERDGFGPVAHQVSELVQQLSASWGKQFVLEPQYERRMRAFYELHDEQNCDRVRQAILELAVR